MFQRLCLTFLFVGLLFHRSSFIRADVTTSVNDGTLQVTIGEPRDFFGEFSGQGQDFDGFDRISLQGELTEDIKIFDLFTGTLVTSVPREGINAISIDVRGDGIVNFEFQQHGFCTIEFTIISGDLSVRATAQRAIFDYFFSEVGGHLTFKGGPGPDWFGGSFPFGLFVGGDLRIDTGSGPDRLTGRDWIVAGHTFIDLGGSTGGLSATPADDDADRCDLALARFSGDLLIKGEQGEDSVSFSNVDLDRDLYVDLGPGADSLRLGGLQVAADSLIFLDGGTGNSDVLSLNGIALLPDEFARFETVNP